MILGCWGWEAPWPPDLEEGSAASTARRWWQFGWRRRWRQGGARVPLASWGWTPMAGGLRRGVLLRITPVTPSRPITAAQPLQDFMFWA